MTTSNAATGWTATPADGRGQHRAAIHTHVLVEETCVFKKYFARFGAAH